jgi:hypothetical protein
MPAFRNELHRHDPELAFAIDWYPHLHSQYAQTAVELGGVGLLALAWVFWELVRGPHRDPRDAALSAALAAVYLTGFVAEPFFSKPLTLTLFAFMAGIISAGRTPQDSGNGTAGTSNGHVIADS